MALNGVKSITSEEEEEQKKECWVGEAQNKKHFARKKDEVDETLVRQQQEGGTRWLMATRWALVGLC